MTTLKSLARVLKCVLGWSAWLLLFACLRPGGVTQSGPEPQKVAAAKTATPAAPTVQTFKKQPLRFEANRGQVDGRVRYVARRGGASLFLTDAGATLSLAPRSKDEVEARGPGKRPARPAPPTPPKTEGPREPNTVLTLAVAGGRKVVPVAETELVTKTNYFIGSDPKKWQRDVPSYGRVTYPGVLDGVDLVYHGEEGQLEYDFVVAPGTDPRSVALDVGGAKGLTLTESGDLAIHTARGDVIQPRPRVFQRDDAGREREVHAGYRLVGRERVAFELGGYDRSRPVVIDPVISYGALIGGSDADVPDFGGTLAVDGSGNAYVAGYTSGASFPNTIGSDPTDNQSAFTAKLGPSGAILWATFVGGSSSDYGYGVAVDGSGNTYVNGYTLSTDLPAAANAPSGDWDAFVTKLSAAGAVVFSTYVGGSSVDYGYGVAVDGSSNAYVVGYSYGGLPSATNTFSTTGDAFVAKVSAAGAVVSTTYVGGSNYDYGYGVAVDGSGNAYLTGETSSTGLPSATNAYSASFDGFVAKVSAAGAVVYSTYVGGSNYDLGFGVTVDGSGQVYVAGETYSSSLPAALNARSGDSDAFVTKLNADGTVAFSRWIGGSGPDVGYGITLDGSGNIHTSGYTCSADFTATGKTHDGSCDAFVAKLTPAGALTSAFRFGGTTGDYASGGVKVGADGAVYVAGQTYSSNFPKTVGQAFAGGADAFVVKLVDATPLALDPATPSSVAPGGAITFTVSGGVEPYTFALTNPSGGTLTSLSSTQTKYTAGSAGGASGATDTLKVTDGSGGSATVTITVTAALAVSAGSTNLPVNGTTSLTVSGGSGTGYVVSGTPGCGTVAATADPTVFTYTATTASCSGTITFKDSLDQTASTPMTVGDALAITGAPSSVPPKKTVTLGTTGGAPGAITWAFAGGVSNSGGTLEGGVYKSGPTGSVTDHLTATDSVGNVATADIDVTAGITITSATSTAPLGEILLAGSGGSNNGFAWSVTSATPRGTISGTHPAAKYTAGATGSVSDTIKVVDDLGNEATATITITAALSIQAPTSVTVPPRGTASFTAQNGAGGYSFSVETPAHGTISTVAAVGNYTAGADPNLTDSIKVTDANGATATATVTIGPGVTLAAAATDLPPNGTTTLTATGGSGTFAIAKWGLSPGGSSGMLTAAADGTASFKAGTAGGPTGTSDTITVTDSLGNSASIVISVGGGLVIDQGTSITRPPRGTATFSAHGGDATAYTWSLVTSPAPSGGSITAAGVYTAGSTGSVTDKIRVTDNVGSTADIDVVVTAGITITSIPPSLNVAPLAAIDFNASGGSNSGFSWTLEKSSGADATIDASNGDYKAGSAGNGTDVVHVVDDLGNTAKVNVTVSAPLTLSSTASSVPPRGSATFTAGAGQPPYTYAIQTPASGAPTITTAGLYKAGVNPNVTDVVKVTDANGAVVTLSIDTTAGVSITPATPSSPPRGSIAFSATGGSGAGFTWSIPINASRGSIDPATGAYKAGAAAKTVDQVKVVDGLGNSAVVNVSVGGGIAINPAGATVAPRGSLNFSAVGGSGTGFTWKLLAGPSGGAINASTGGYTAGSMPNVTDRIQVIDSVGNGSTVDVIVGKGLSISPSLGSVSPGGKLVFTTTGGNPGGITYKIEPNGSGGTISTSGEYRAGKTGSTTDVVVATDAFGNTAEASITVGAGLTVAPTSASVPPGGKQSFAASNGAGGYVFSFQTNASDGTISASGNYVAGKTPNVTDTVRVTDASGAVVTMTITVGAGVTITPPSAMVPPRGTVDFSATGGSGTGFVWSFSRSSSAGSISATGQYKAGAQATTFDTVQVVDSLGNKATANVSVGGALIVTPATGSVAPRGTLAFQAAGGAGGYAWSLSANASGATIDATSGAYTAGSIGGVTDIVQVADAAGNKATVNVTVGASLRITPEAASAKPGGKVTFSVTGGSGTGFNWKIANNLSGGSVDQNGSYTAGSTTTVTDTIEVTDSLGNEAQAFVAVTPDGSAPTTPPPGSPTTNGSATGTIGDDSGGCSASPTTTSSSSVLPILALVAAAALSGRRRRRD